MQFLGHSNKKIYFQTLFEQFQKLKTFHPKFSKNIHQCPSFHNLFLELDREKRHLNPRGRILEINPQHLKQWMAGQEEDEVLSLFPELSLPIDHSNKMTIYQALHQNNGQNTKEALRQGLKVHVEKTYEELLNLCETGHGHNYFIFANMVSYTQKNPHFKNGPKAFSALLKTTVFSNYLLLHALSLPQRGRPPLPNLSKKEENFLSRLNAHWSSTYLNQLRKKRLALQ